MSPVTYDQRSHHGVGCTVPVTEQTAFLGILQKEVHVSRVFEVAVKLQDVRVFERFHDLDFTDQLFFRTWFRLQSTLLNLFHCHENVRFVSQLHFNDGTVSTFADDLHR